MYRITLVRSVAFLVAAIATLWMTLAIAVAQTAQPAGVTPPSPEKLRQLAELLDDPEIRAWLNVTPAPEAAPDDVTLAEQVSQWEAIYRNHLAALRDAIPRLPEEFSRAANVVATEVNSGMPGKGIAIVAVLIAVGYAAEWLFLRALASGGPDDRALVAEPDGGGLAIRIVSRLGSLVVFSFAIAGLFLAFDWPPLLRKIVLTYLLAFMLFRTVVAIGGILISPDSQTDEAASRAARMLPVSDVEARFWHSRLQLAASYFLFAWATLSRLPELGFSVEVVQLASYVFGLGLLAMAIEIVWHRPAVRLVGTRTIEWLLTGYLVLLWLIWIGGLYGLLWLGIYALLLPKAVSGAGLAAETSVVRDSAASISRFLLNVLIVRGVRTLVIAGAVAWLAAVWRFSPAAAAHNAMLERVVVGVLNGIIVLLAADLAWNLAKTYFAHKIETATLDGAVSAEVAAHRSRLRTLLPIFRNTLAVFILVVAALTILSGLGVQIAPLIAGAGIFGVAIGFGSQTLVKDVLSGVFYMMDDAFRVGEYIQSGRYMGTVESFSLRSVKLRHHRGPIFTVPFGDLGAVQNMSRDWVVDKMTLNITYDSDIDLARKLIKKIGLELAQDPEFAPSVIQPMKMQGVQNFGDFAVELRIKMMTKPGEQFGMKRKALVMIKKAFEDNGIKLAVPTVHVSGGHDEAAAASEALRLRKSAELAANNA